MQIIKRGGDGRKQKYNVSKIEKAVKKAFVATHKRR